jgi:hypothetical protein
MKYALSIIFMDEAMVGLFRPFQDDPSILTVGAICFIVLPVFLLKFLALDW